LSLIQEGISNSEVEQTA